MFVRPLLICLLIIIAQTCHASGEINTPDTLRISSPCPPNAIAELQENESSEAPNASQRALPRPVTPPAAANANNTGPRTGLRWRSFLPGMMK